MVEKERSVHISTSTANGVANNKKGVEVSRMKRSEDDKHWDFLDEIEAPMWLDLTLEMQSTCHDKDDGWFDRSHPFHQCSSRQLISAFSHSAEGCTNFKLDVRGQSSPKLPPSVSRSRGKEYRSRDWGQGNQRVIFNLQHPVKKLSKKSLNADFESKRTARDKRTSGMLIELPGSKSDSTGESNSPENAEHCDLSLLPPSCNQNICLNSEFHKEEESNSSSTITFEGSEQQQQKSLEVCSKVFGQSIGFFSALKVSLRKSCVTRQASRMEAFSRRQSEDQKSASSKSSVGSSSNLGFDGKYQKARENKDMTLDSRKIVSIRKAPNVKVYKESLSTVPAVQDRAFNPKCRSQNFTLQSIHQGNTKSKVPQQTLKAKGLAPEGGKKHCTPGMSVNDKEKRIPGLGAGKENPAAKVSVSQKSRSSDAQQVQKVIKRRVAEQSCRTKFLGSKEKTKGRSEEKKAEKVYFR